MPTTDPATADPIIQLSTDALRSELLGLAGHLAAAQCRFLQLLAEFDRRGAWAGADIRSCAHWLSWRIGMSLRTATEQLRVAHALRALPAITEAFAAGRISYSKVRAITRLTHPYPAPAESAPNASSNKAANAEDADEAPGAVAPDTTAPDTSQPAAAPPATAATNPTAPFQAAARGPDGRLTADAEKVMLDLAMAGTASHVEKVVRATRGRLLDPQRLSAQRRVSWRWDDDGTLVLRGRFPPADGAALIAAIEAHLPEPQTRTPDQPVPDDVVPAGAEQRPGAVADRRAARRADALVELATRPDTAPAPNLAEGTHLIMHIGTATALQPATATAPTRSAEPDTAQTAATANARPTATEPEQTPPRRIGTQRSSMVPYCYQAQPRGSACDARVRPSSRTPRPNRLYLGRTRRLASPAQLAALTVRDHGSCHSRLLPHPPSARPPRPALAVRRPHRCRQPGVDLQLPPHTDPVSTDTASNATGTPGAFYDPTTPPFRRPRSPSPAAPNAWSSSTPPPNYRSSPQASLPIGEANNSTWKPSSTGSSHDQHQPPHDRPERSAERFPEILR